MSDYLFHSNYPYFEALHLGRFVRYMAKVELGLEAGRNPTQQLCHVAYHAGDVVFKDSLFDPGITAEEFGRQQEEESRRKRLSPEELERELEEEVAKLRREDFEDSNEEWLCPVRDRGRVEEFVRLGRSQLRRLAAFASEGDSLVEDVAARYVEHLQRREMLRGFYAIMIAWDPMRMQHEGRPPYSIRFAPGFFDSLEEIAAEEGDPEPDMARWIERLSKPRPYVMSPRAFALARAGVMRARSFGVIPASVANALEEQLDSWAADLRGGHERTGD